MKTIRIYIALAAAAIFTLASCNKDETKDYNQTYTYDVHQSSTNGQATIKGAVTYLNAATGNYEMAPWSVIKISTDTNTRVFSQYWLTDSLGNYSVKGLGVGSYYITATYTDPFNGAKFNAAGVNLSVKNSVDDITLNFQAK